MANVRIKVYVVQKMERRGVDYVPVCVLAVKLNRVAAQAVAKTYAPCRIDLFVADKSGDVDINANSILGGSTNGTARDYPIRND